MTYRLSLLLLILLPWQSAPYDVTVFSGHYVYNCDGVVFGKPYREAGQIDAVTPSTGNGSWTLKGTMHFFDGPDPNNPGQYLSHYIRITSSATFFLYGANLSASVTQSSDTGDLYVGVDGKDADYVSTESNGRHWKCHFRRP